MGYQKQTLYSTRTVLSTEALWSKMYINISYKNNMKYTICIIVNDDRFYIHMERLHALDHEHVSFTSKSHIKLIIKITFEPIFKTM